MKYIAAIYLAAMYFQVYSYRRVYRTMTASKVPPPATTSFNV